MSLLRDQEAQARLHAMLERNLPQVRTRLEEMARGKNQRRAAEAARMLKRLDDEYGPPESP